MFSDPNYRKIIHLADKYASRKEYECLFPGCRRRAIGSHAIPRASLIDALADKGIVYTERYSFASVMRMSGPTDPVEVTEVGVNKASVFKGFCADHDSKIFAPIETAAPEIKKHLSIAFHLRAMSLEFSRKRLVVEFTSRFAKLYEAIGPASVFSEIAKQQALARDHFKSILDHFFLSAVGRVDDGIDQIFLTFGGNLMVSACGIFTHVVKEQGGHIGFNLISYRDMSLLALTTFTSTAPILNSFLKDYGYPDMTNLERLVNDIAFSKGEEPLIAATLWRSLSENDKLHVRQSLRPPGLRMSATVPRIIKLSRENLIEPTPQMWAHLLGSKSPNDVTISRIKVRKTTSQR